MKLTDFAGNSLAVGDLVVVTPKFVVGQITEIQDGTIALGLSLSSPQPQGIQVQPHLKFEVHMPGVSAALPNGIVPDVLKIAKPEAGQ